MIDFSTLEPGTELSSPKGVVLFKRYKKGNWKDQNVEVIRKRGNSAPFWLKENELELPTSKPLAKLSDKFTIQNYA